MELLADVGEGGARAGIDARHAPVAEGGEQHREHADEDRGDDVATRFRAHHAEDAHRGDGLDDDDAVEDEVPERERATQARGARLRGRFRGAHGADDTRADWISKDR